MNNKKISKFLATTLSAATFAGATLLGGEAYAKKLEEQSDFTSGAVVGVGMTVAGGALALGLCKWKANEFEAAFKRNKSNYKNALEKAKTITKELTQEIGNQGFQLNEDTKAKINESLEKLENFAKETKGRALEGKSKFFSPVLSKKVKGDLRDIAESANVLEKTAIAFKEYLKDEEKANDDGCKALNDALVRAFDELNSVV